MPERSGRPDGGADRTDRSDPATRAVHAGEEPGSAVTRRPAGAVVWQTAPFVFDSTEELDAAFAAGGREGVYSRYGNPTVRLAEEKLASLEGAEEAVAFASGLAAVSAAARERGALLVVDNTFATPALQNPTFTSHRSLDPDARRALGIGDGMLRLSVGIEGIDDLRADLEQALEGLS